jgi:hypothetical protein
LRVYELQDLSATFAELDTRVYELAYPQGELGLVYVAPTSSTLVFDGVLDFGGLEQEALLWLPPKVFGRSLRLDYDSFFMATLFTRDGDIVKLEKDDPQGTWTGFHDWQRLMLQSEKLRAARFDVALKSSSDRFGEASRWYVLTADNPQYEEDGIGEITLQLPGGLAWTAELIRWVIAHHAQAEQLEGDVLVDVLAAELNRVQKRWVY